MIDDNALGAILARLGNTSAEVAATLHPSRIQGVRNTVRFFNPIVRFTQRELQVDISTLDTIQPNTLRLNLPDRIEEVCLPAAVQEFLDAFNRGEYPELELSTENA